MAGFVKIAITPPDVSPADMGRAVSLLERGEADILHLRVPEASYSEMEALVDAVPDSLRSRVRLHSHFGLIGEYGLGGAHLNSRSPAPPGVATSLSRSCHSIGDIREAVKAGIFEYVTLSPVFDSISKKGYKGNDELLEVPHLITDMRIVALGGVTPDVLPLLRQKGFAGAAMLGYYFPR